MTAPFVRPLLSILLTLVFMGLTSTKAAAQSITSARLGVRQLAPPIMPAPSQWGGDSGIPRWVKWWLGGAIAVYDWVCKPDSGSQRAGLC